jgi:hypothetical protein
MNSEDIIRMAQDVSGVEFPASMDGVKIGMSIEHLERFANLVAAAEREACAKVCDVFAVSAFDDEAGIALNIQKSIRARGQG